MLNTSDLVELIERASSLPEHRVHTEYHRLSAAFDAKCNSEGMVNGLCEAMNRFYEKTYPQWCYKPNCALCDLDEWRT